MGVHSEQVTSNLHVAAYTVANAAARIVYAATLTSAQRGMEVLQLDNGSMWVCTAAATLTAIATNTEAQYGIVKQVNSGGEFTTIQAALDWFKGKAIMTNLSGSPCTIEVDPGTYNETITAKDLFTASDQRLLLWGDDRTLVGITYVDGTPGNRGGITNGGSGIVALSNSGNDLLIGCGTSNPNLVTAGIVNGDKILVGDNSRAIAEFTVASVSGHTLTLTGTAPTVGNTGSWVCLLPNRRITNAGATLAVQSNGLIVQGFYIYSSGDSALQLSGNYPATLHVTNCAIRGNYGALIQGQSELQSCTDYAIGAPSGVVSFVGCANDGLLTTRGASANLFYPCFAGCNVAARADTHSIIALVLPVSGQTVANGFKADQHSMIDVGSAAVVAVHNGPGSAYAFLAGMVSFISADNTVSLCSGNDHDYSPGTTETVGNGGSVIRFS